MTLTIAWIRKSGRTSELIIASDSRLRSYGAVDQTQKIFPLKRGDCALAFAGDATVAYPFFVQASSALDSHLKIRTKAEDITAVSSILGRLLNNLIESWDIGEADRVEQLRDTRILFAGWSWRYRRFEVGFFKYVDGRFRYLKSSERLSRPFRERSQSLIVLGDYRVDYLKCLSSRLNASYRPATRYRRFPFDFGYEPLQALNEFLADAQTRSERHYVGGAPQAVKIYAHGNTMPLVLRTGERHNFLFGRRLLSWEKTEFPIADLTREPIAFLYPGDYVPTADNMGAQPPRPLSMSDMLRDYIRFLTGGPTLGR